MLTFLSPVDYPAGPAPQAVAIADFDNDGNADGAIVNFDAGINILLGDGRGGLAPPYSGTRGEWPHAYPLAAGDIDGDGNADLIYGDQALLGNGDGTFRDPQYLGFPAEAEIYPLRIDSIAPGDFNIDGVLDLAYSLTGSSSWCDPYDPYWCGTFPHSYVAVALGQGDGTFSVGNYQYLTGPSSANAGDIDHDGALDLVTADGVYYGDGTGTFLLRGPAIPELVSASPWYSSIRSSLADYDADGNLDLMLVNSTNLPVLLGDANGGFQDAALLHEASGEEFIAAGDLDHDGFADALATGPNSTSVSVLMNDQQWPGQDPPGVAGDYNNDGVVDTTDYIVWRNNLGAPAGTLLNDPNAATIGQAQYDTWRANYGATAGSISGVIDSVAVPEPTTLVLLIMATSGAVIRRRPAAVRVSKLVDACDRPVMDPF